jgi:hypothetical protein
VSSFLFVLLTVVMTALAAWFFGTGVGRDSRSHERELSGAGRRER